MPIGILLAPVAGPLSSLAAAVTAAVSSTVTAIVTTAALLVTSGLAPAATPTGSDACTWRLSAVRLYEELTGQTDARSAQLRQLLSSSGVGASGFLPTQCTSGPGNTGGTGSTGNSAPNATTPSGPTPSNTTPSAGPSGATTPPGPGTGTGAGNGRSGTSNCPITAGATLNWGQPNREDDFTDPSTTKNWGMYDGPGHAGNGRRAPTAASILGGLLTITGDAQGNSEGMAWNPGQRYGRWEGCVKSPPGTDSLHSLLLLWPDAENWPVGGEVDFMEISDPSRQSVDSFLHYGADNQQESGSIKIDAGQWHAWAVEWTPHGITQYVDGKKWWSTTDTSHLPPGPMHLCIQLDYFGGDASAGAKEIVNWVRQYPLNSSGASSGTSSSSPGSGPDAPGSGSSGSSGE